LLGHGTLVLSVEVRETSTTLLNEPAGKLDSWIDDRHLLS
jgi:hypothetical protein